MKKWWILVLCLVSWTFAFGQTGTAFGVKGGLVLGNQTWNNSDREFLFGYHGDLFIESVNDSSALSIYGSLGYHMRGSAIRIRESFNPQTMQTFPRRRLNQPFRNLSLQVGAKGNHHLPKDGIKGFYGLGLRLEYTLDYDLAFQTEGFDLYLNRFTYGLSILGGFEFEFPNFPGAIFIEMSFHQDIGKQIFLPGNTVPYFNPFTNQTLLYPEQSVINRSIEISLGYKFIRRVEWVDADEW